MISTQIPQLAKDIDTFVQHKESILDNWVYEKTTQDILSHHHIDVEMFKLEYASNVFDYFIAVIYGKMKLGQCPVMNKLLEYFKDKDISADELFSICSHFRKSMIEFSYDRKINSKKLFDDISYLFDLNFSGLLKQYTDTIFQKEQEIAKNVALLNEYKRAIDRSALVSKTNKQGVITYVNDNFCQLCEFSREELIGSTHAIMRHEDMSHEFFRELWREIEDKKLFRATIKNRKKGGEYFFIDTTIVPIINPFNDEIEYMSLGYEVTSLVDARQEALRADRAKDYFLSNMSHEIRTPLNAILGFVALMQDDEVDEVHKKYLDIIHNSGESLLHIINDILDFSKLRQGEFSVEVREFNLHSELTHTLELFVASAYEKDITLLSFIDPKIPQELKGDPLRIKQIISNLLSNAIKFTPSGGYVELEACYENEKLNIAIKDSGIGIAQEKLLYIFDPFLQLQHASTRTNGGTGLGLSICKHLAKHMGGDVFVKSKVSKGSTFTLSLPTQTAQSVSHLDYDISMFQKLTLAFYMPKKQELREYQSLARYMQSFDITLQVSDRLDDENVDVLFVVERYLTAQQRQMLLEIDRVSIVLTNSFSERFSENDNVTPLSLPMYCAKLYEVFLEALHMTPSRDKTFIPPKKRRRFDGDILVAEDNSANQELIKTLLDKYALNYYVVSDGVEALHTFKRAAFDLVLMDEQMPNMDGIEATKQMLAYEKEYKSNHTPIIALSANVIKGEEQKRVQHQLFDAFLGKPIDIKALEKIFERFLKERYDLHEQKVVHRGDAHIYGIDVEMIQQELSLEYGEILMLIETFIQKMQSSLMVLADAIEVDDYEKIAKIAHSIKGSAANFRIDAIQQKAAAMERAATQKDSSFEYKREYEALAKIVKTIYIQD